RLRGGAGGHHGPALLAVDLDRHEEGRVVRKARHLTHCQERAVELERLSSGSAPGQSCDRFGPAVVDFGILKHGFELVGGLLDAAGVPFGSAAKTSSFRRCETLRERHRATL